MIRWYGSTRHRSDAVSARVLAGWPGRLALVAIALGLVLMHHVVGAHQHAGADAPHPGPVAPSVVEPRAAPPTADHAHPAAPEGGGSEPAVAHETPSGVPVESSAAVLHHHPDGSGHDHSESLLHMCLVALLSAAIFVLALVLVASWWRVAPRATAERGHTSSAEPCAPPTSTRLAELQLLRL